MNKTIQDVLESQIEDLEEEFSALENGLADMLSDEIEYDDDDWDFVYNNYCDTEDEIVKLTLELEAIK